MSSQPPDEYPPQNAPWPAQGPDASPSAGGYPPPDGYPPPGYPGVPQGYYAQSPGIYPRMETDARAGLAIASLVLGIIGILGAIFLCGSPFAIAGIVCGALGQASTTKKTLAIVGLVLSVIGLIISLIVIAFIVVAAITQGATQPATP